MNICLISSNSHSTPNIQFIWQTTQQIEATRTPTNDQLSLYFPEFPTLPTSSRPNRSSVTEQLSRMSVGIGSIPAKSTSKTWSRSDQITECRATVKRERTIELYFPYYLQTTQHDEKSEKRYVRNGKRSERVRERTG